VLSKSKIANATKKALSLKTMRHSTSYAPDFPYKLLASIAKNRFTKAKNFFG
jgi:hypothetical protein